jgi:surfeit locus 1 family protein
VRVATFDRAVLRQPRWIIAIVVAALLALLFVRLAFWQLDRLDQRRASNALIAARSDDAPRPLDALIAEFGDDPADLEYRRAIVEGVYRPDLEFFSIGRTFDDLTGTLVVTPLELADGSLLVVIRGLVPAGTPGPPAAGFATPDGRVILEGRIDDGEEPLRIGEPDPVGGTLRSISRIDLAYIDRWTEGDVLPISLVLDRQEPHTPEQTPVPMPEDEPTEGPHLGYAVQWAGFAIVALVGVMVLVWRAGTAREPVVTHIPPDSDA